MANLQGVLASTGSLGNALTSGGDLASLSVTSGKLAAGAVIAGKIGYNAVKPYQAVGVSAAGPITVTGVAVGDKVEVAFGWVTSAGTIVGLDSTHFEATVTVANQIQQLSADLSLNTYLFLVQPQS